MSRNGSGTYTLASGNPVVTGTIISSTWANNTLNDIASALTQSLASDGQTPATSDFDFGGFKIQNVGNGVASGDVVNIGQLGDTSNTALGDALIGVKRTLTGAIATNLHNYLDGSELNLKRDFGAVGDGTTDDTAAIQAAINAGTTVYVFPATYRITKLTGVANSKLISPKATFKLAASSTVSDYMFYAASAPNITLDGITFDWNNAAWSGAGLPVNLGVISSDGFKFLNGGCINFRVFGLASNSSNDVVIDNNYFAIITQVNTINKSISIQSTVTASTRVHITNNRMIGSSLALDASYVWVKDNYINGFKYGGGISAEQSANSSHNYILDNTILNGTGTDSDATLQSGMEIWAPYSVISRNFIAGCAGAGIDNGSLYGTVTDNFCLNNCRDGGTNIAGIVSRYGDATYNATGSRYLGNVSIDAGGGGGIQDYGYADQSSSLANIDLVGNTFYPNKTKQVRILSTTTTFTGRTLQGSSTYDPASLTNGSRTSTGITVPGAVLGDSVRASFSLSLQGILLYAEVTATNTVTAYLQNNTGGTIDLGSGTLRVYVMQNTDSIGY